MDNTKLEERMRYFESLDPNELSIEETLEMLQVSDAYLTVAMAEWSTEMNRLTALHSKLVSQNNIRRNKG